MAVTTYSYSGATYQEQQLSQEISVSSISTATLQYINGTGATGATGSAALATAVAITFSTALSAGDKTTLDGVVSAHVVRTPSDAQAQQPNLLSNGGFDFWQRQSPTSLTTVAQDGYGPDRWRMSRQNASLQSARTAAIAGVYSRYMGQFSKITNAGKFMVIQILEGRDSLPLQGLQVTFQCKLQAVSVSTYTVRIGIIQLNSSGTLDSWPAATVSAWGATGTDPTLGTNLAYVGTPVSCSVNPTGGSYSASAFLPNYPNAAKNIAVAIWTDSATFAVNDGIAVAEAQLTVGSHTQEFAPPNLQAELARCQRYYEKSFDIDTAPADADTTAIRYSGNAYDTGDVNVYLPFQVSKRITGATLTYYRSSVGASAGKWSYYNAGWNDSTTTVNTAASQQGFCTEVRKTLAFTGLSDYLIAGGWAASCEL